MAIVSQRVKTFHRHFVQLHKFGFQEKGPNYKTWQKLGLNIAVGAKKFWGLRTLPRISELTSQFPSKLAPARYFA